MANNNNSHGGTHGQHVKAGQQSHKTQHQGEASGKQMSQNDGGSRGTQGGTHEQHVNAGKQSHKNS